MPVIYANYTVEHETGKPHESNEKRGSCVDGLESGHG